MINSGANCRRSSVLEISKIKTASALNDRKMTLNAIMKGTPYMVNYYKLWVNIAVDLCTFQS